MFQVLHSDIPGTEKVISDPRIQHIQFTGSVKTGKKVNSLVASSGSLATVGLELGGNDAAYVRADADVISAAENLVDGAMYNSGQSCCGIQRIYVHSSCFDAFVAKAVEETKVYIISFEKKGFEIKIQLEIRTWGSF